MSLPIWEVNAKSAIWRMRSTACVLEMQELLFSVVKSSSFYMAKACGKHAFAWFAILGH